MDARARPDDGYSRIVRLASGPRFCVAEFGAKDGLPVLALHGAPACRLMFDVTDDAARALGLHIIAFDRPGYGHSPLDYGYSLARRTDTFIELINALGLDRFVLLGVSGGGPYAVALAARLGSRVRGLALVSPLGPLADLQERAKVDAGGKDTGIDQVPLSLGHRAFFLDLPRHTWLLRVNAEIAMRSFRAAPRFFAHTFSHLLPESDRKVVAAPEIERSIVEMTLEATRSGIGGGIADLEIYGKPWDVDYAAITAPTRIWQGLDDHIVPAAAALALGNLIPGARVERIEGAGHFWVYGQVSSVLADIKDMAADVRAAPAAPGS
ncbi:MAG: alpha/beta fold hydrolase [Hyphomicrobiaceae bacterium]